MFSCLDLLWQNTFPSRGKEFNEVSSYWIVFICFPLTPHWSLVIPGDQCSLSYSGMSKHLWQWYLHNITESNFAKIKLFSVSSVMEEVPDTCKWTQNLLLTFASKTIWNSILCVGRCQSVKYCVELDLIELFHKEPNNGENDSRYDK